MGLKSKTYSKIMEDVNKDIEKECKLNGEKYKNEIVFVPIVVTRSVVSDRVVAVSGCPSSAVIKYENEGLVE